MQQCFGTLPSALNSLVQLLQTNSNCSNLPIHSLCTKSRVIPSTSVFAHTLMTHTLIFRHTAGLYATSAVTGYHLPHDSADSLSTSITKNKFTLHFFRFFKKQHFYNKLIMVRSFHGQNTFIKLVWGFVSVMFRLHYIQV